MVSGHRSKRGTVASQIVPKVTPTPPVKKDVDVEGDINAAIAALTSLRDHLS